MRFLDALKEQKNEGGVVLIPDIKCFSPKEGDLMRGRDPVRLALELEQAGACAVSVVTEEREFHGSMQLLADICRSVHVPVLRKDFIETEQDLDETVQAGADAILLMVSCLGEERLTALYHAALQKGLTPFVETHTEQELRFALRLNAPLVGINNRDIKVLEKDDGTVQHAGALLQTLGEHTCFIVVESALQNADEVRAALKSGADGALVGTAILQAEQAARQYEIMTRRAGLKICGLMTEQDVDACLSQGVDLCGFVVDYPVAVRWNLTAREALPLLQRAGASLRTCVVTGGDIPKVLSLARQLKPDYLQLHYTESLEETGAIASALKKEGIGVIRSVSNDPQLRVRMFGTDRLSRIIERLEQTDLSGILLDSRDAANAAAEGTSLLPSLEKELRDGRLASLLKRTDKYILAGGGITPTNAGEVVRFLHPDYLDVMTGAEDAGGCKSEEIIRRLVQAVRG